MAGAFFVGVPFIGGVLMGSVFEYLLAPYTSARITVTIGSLAVGLHTLRKMQRRELRKGQHAPTSTEWADAAVGALLFGIAVCPVLRWVLWFEWWLVRQLWHVALHTVVWMIKALHVDTYSLHAGGFEFSIKSLYDAT
eukprot:TRINITY_DN7842_c0_g1_i1.p1 TRINITY_DN7842_c0_g1~~TRINITY_DN7842_c0_g1_i1.p1  ORF type:complete len:138 (-),score=29.32 TRINITY_DN7842_c0_g1_i1:128-541(-)